MKTKDSYKITNILFNKTILDMEVYSDNENSWQPTEYLLFVKVRTNIEEQQYDTMMKSFFTLQGMFNEHLKQKGVD